MRIPSGKALRNVVYLLGLVVSLVCILHLRDRPSPGKLVMSVRGQVRGWKLRRETSRESLWGDTLEERAFPHYDRALELSRAFDHDELLELHEAETDEELVRRAEVVEEALPLLDSLRRGAHARDAERELDLEGGIPDEFYGLMDSRHVTQLAELRAAVLLAEGDELEAVRTLLDAMQFAGDLSGSQMMIEELIGGALLVPRLLREWLEDGTAFELSSEAFECLAEGVTALDARLAWSSHAFPTELLFAVREVTGTLDGDGRGADEGSFRFPDGVLSNLRLRYALPDFVSAALKGHLRYRRAFELPPAEALQALASVEAELEAVDNVLAETFFPAFRVSANGRLCSVARLRLVAHALACEAEPRDPWIGELLRTERVDGGERLTLAHDRFEHVELVLGG